MASIEELKPYATPRQWEVLQTIHKHNGSYREAARVLGINHANVSRLMLRLRKAAARAGYAPEYDLTHPVPPGFRAESSTLYDAEGNILLQWIKSAADKKQLDEMLREAMEAFCESMPRQKAVAASKKHKNEELLNLYIITDYHLGMKAWSEETRDADWDTDIAEDLLARWFMSGIASAPDSETAVLAQLGDFMHWDGMDAVTPQNRHLLDADTRFAKIVRVAIRALMRVTNELLKKHDKVHVIMAEGNHDPASSVWLREWFSAWFENEPRVTVDTSPDPYYCYEFGRTSLFFHHGHKRAVKNIDHVWTAKFREVFGRTEYSYGHLGHLHHRNMIESTLMTVEQHPTMAAPDAYASRGGWLSKRAAHVMTYHKQYGEVGRLAVTPEMLED